MDEFVKICHQHGIAPPMIYTHVIPEVKEELEKVSEEDDMTVQEFLRAMIDDYLEQRGV